MMRILMVVLLVGTGCHATTGTKVGIGTAAVFGVAAGVSASDCWPPDDNYDCSDSRTNAYVLTALALVAVGVAVLSAVMADNPPSEAVHSPATSSTTFTAGPPGDSQAAQLTRQAHVAASLGQCDAVKSMGARVATLDRAFYLQVFVPDPVLQPCL